MKNKPALVLVTALTGLMATALWCLRDTTDTPRPTPPAHISTTAQPAQPMAAKPNVESTLGTDANGHLNLDPHTQAVMNNWLGQGTPSATNIAHAQDNIRTQLQEPARSEALQLLDKLARYRTAANQASAQRPAPSSEAQPAGTIDLAAAASLQHDQALRQQYLGTATNTALNSDTDAIARYQLAKQQVMQMNGLSQEQKNEQVEAMYRQLPETARRVVGSSE